VAFAGGTEAHHESNGPWRDPFLTHRRDDRRIEKRNRLEGVLHREAGAHEQLPRPAQPRLDRHGGTSHFKVVGEDLKQVLMLGAKKALKLCQLRFDLRLGSRQRSRDDIPGTVHIARAEEPGNDAVGIRRQPQRQSGDGNRTNQSLRGPSTHSIIDPTSVTFPRGAGILRVNGFQIPNENVLGIRDMEFGIWNSASVAAQAALARSSQGEAIGLEPDDPGPADERTGNQPPDGPAGRANVDDLDQQRPAASRAPGRASRDRRARRTTARRRRRPRSSPLGLDHSVDSP
jgi:hypothetical protein